MTILLRWPVKGPITQYFGENPHYYAQWGYPGHNGIDFGIPNGTPIMAANVGIVDKVAYETGGYGRHVRVQHVDEDTTYYTYYCHLMSTDVDVNQQVEAGQVIAHSNHTGASTGPHLHFGLRIMGQNPEYKGYVDPMPYLIPEIPTDPVEPPEIVEPLNLLPGAISIPEEIDFEVTASYLNVRSGPGIEYPQIDNLSSGDVVHGKQMFSPEIWIELEDGNWCAVTHGGTDYLKFEVNDDTTEDAE